jgi:hypothetical protein
LNLKDRGIETKEALVDFNKTTFISGFNAAYGKVPVKLELMLSFSMKAILSSLRLCWPGQNV